MAAIIVAIVGDYIIGVLMTTFREPIVTGIGSAISGLGIVLWAVLLGVFEIPLPLGAILSLFDTGL